MFVNLHGTWRQPAWKARAPTSQQNGSWKMFTGITTSVQRGEQSEGRLRMFLLKLVKAVSNVQV